MPDALPASQLQKVTYQDFKVFLERQGFNRRQVQDGWHRLCYRLPFIKREFGLEIVCTDCDRIMPCMCDEPERLPSSYAKYVLTRRWLVGLPERAFATLGDTQAGRVRGFIEHLRAS